MILNLHSSIPPVRCRYCKKTNHTISECFKLKKKKEMEGEKQETSVKQVMLASDMQVLDTNNDIASPVPVFPVHPLFAPFCNDASICCDDGSVVNIKVLRDTAALQSLLLESAVSLHAMFIQEKFAC